MYARRVRDIEELAERSRKDRDDSAERDKQAVIIQRQLLAEMQSLRNERDALLRALNDANTKSSSVAGGGSNQALQSEMQTLRNERDALLRALHNANVNVTVSPSSNRNSAVRNSNNVGDGTGDAASHTRSSQQVDPAKTHTDKSVPTNNIASAPSNANAGAAAAGMSTPARPGKVPEDSTPSSTPRDRVALVPDGGVHMSDFDFANASERDMTDPTLRHPVSDLSGTPARDTATLGSTADARHKPIVPTPISDVPSPAKEKYMAPSAHVSDVPSPAKDEKPTPAKDPAGMLPLGVYWLADPATRALWCECSGHIWLVLSMAEFRNARIACQRCFSKVLCASLTNMPVASQEFPSCMYRALRHRPKTVRQALQPSLPAAKTRLRATRMPKLRCRRWYALDAFYVYIFVSLCVCPGV
jgi:hypothetical protein